jgi:hypothetical protein
VTTTRPSPRALVTLLALTFLGVSIAIVRSAVYRMNPDVIGWGVTFDLTLSLPLCWWLFVVRPGHAKPLTLIPLFVVCMAVASRVVPHDGQTFLRQLRFIGAPLDVVTIVLVARRALGMRTRVREADDDLLARITAACTQLFGNARAGEAVAFEVATLWYAVASWRTPTPRDGHSVHERSGWGSILACILVLLAAESLGLHLFVMRWSTTAAWIVTALDVYGVLWLIGDYHALRLRRTTIDADGLHLRYGLRWSIDVPASSIASMTTVTKEADWKRRDVLKVAILEEPRFLITFTAPQVVHGIAGIRKRVNAIAILPDDIERFEREMRSIRA